MQCNFDIILLQETWLYSFEEPMISEMFKNYHSISSSAMKSYKHCRGRPYGGTAILIKEDYKSIILSVDISDPRLLTIKFSKSYGELLLINVYLPCYSLQNEEVIHKYLVKLERIVSQHDGPVLVIGDFNMSPTHRTFYEIQKICDDNELVIEDMRKLPPDTFTFCSANYQSKSWIDHAISTNDLILNVNIPYTCTPSDHLLLEIHIADLIPKNGMKQNFKHVTHRKIKWNNLSEKQVMLYKNRVYDKLTEKNWEFCTGNNCTNRDHHLLIDSAFQEICNIMVQSSNNLNSSGSKKKTKIHVIVGWNDNVRQQYHDYRIAFQQWTSTGKCDANLYVNLCVKRKIFKAALKNCKKEKNRYLSDNLALSFNGKVFKKFWCYVKSCDNGQRQSVPNSVDNVSGEKSVSEYWADIYSKLFSTPQSDTHAEAVRDYILNGENNLNFVPILPKNTISAIKNLKNNKAVGSDNLQAEHLKYAGWSIILPLTNLMNSMLCHSYIPQNLMKVVIVPILKKKGADPSKSLNYRPIALASTLSKIF